MLSHIMLSRQKKGNMPNFRKYVYTFLNGGNEINPIPTQLVKKKSIFYFFYFRKFSLVA